MRRRRIAVLAALCITAVSAPASGTEGAPLCAPGGEPITYDGEVTGDDARSYIYLPFDVHPETTRIEVGYDWGESGPVPGTPLTATTVDLGLWDENGTTGADGFRGWSGSRHKQIHVQADSAERGYLAAPVEPGVWHVELGVAAVGLDGGWWEAEIRCLNPVVGPSPTGTAANPDPVDPDHVARAEPGWYHGDFHMHAHHSHPDAPTWDEFIAFAREQQLDFLPITEYVTTAHWYELGAVQRAHPDLLVWPGREIITYEGHAIALNETWDHVEYRHGHDGITMADIQRDARADGALFQVAHPTTFEGPLFENLCRGCSWELDEQTDWSAVETIEVLTGPAVARPLGDPNAPGIENPFMTSAIVMWEDLLNEGYRITAVGGSDDKWAGERTDELGTISPHGVPATAVYADELSRAGLTDALRRGRAYVRTRGVAGSPALEISAVTPDGDEGTFGAVLPGDSAEVTVTVTGGSGQVLVAIQNGEPQLVVPVIGEDFTHTFTVERDEGSEGPLGTWWRVETRDHEARTTIGNPIFLTDGDDQDPPAAAPEPPDEDERPLPATGAGAVFGAIGLMLAGVMLRRERHRDAC